MTALMESVLKGNVKHAKRSAVLTMTAQAQGVVLVRLMHAWIQNVVLMMTVQMGNVLMDHA